jgi:hypothetical protein
MVKKDPKNSEKEVKPADKKLFSALISKAPKPLPPKKKTKAQ